MLIDIFCRLIQEETFHTFDFILTHDYDHLLKVLTINKSVKQSLDGLYR